MFESVTSLLTFVSLTSLVRPPLNCSSAVPPKMDSPITSLSATQSFKTLFTSVRIFDFMSATICLSGARLLSCPRAQKSSDRDDFSNSISSGDPFSFFDNSPRRNRAASMFAWCSPILQCDENTLELPPGKLKRNYLTSLFDCLRDCWTVLTRSLICMTDLK